jgi:PAS domain-containing protein
MKTTTLKRTTLRLPTELHRQLRVTAAEQRTTSEAILVEAVRRELERRNATPRRLIEIPSAMNSLLAELLIQSMPTFALIKDRRARIVWVNAFFEKALQSPLSQVVGVTITEAGLIEGIQKETIDENVRQALKDKRPMMSVEGMVLKGLGSVTARTQRFVFGDGFLGDISFVENDIKTRHFDTDRDVVSRMQRTLLDRNVSGLLVPFLEAAPLSIAVKKPVGGDSMILWANSEYLRLTRAKKIEHVIGRTTREVFRLPPAHAILSNEADVAESGRALMAKEALPSRQPRWSLRFPIFDAHGSVALLGVVSPDFQPNTATRF